MSRALALVQAFKQPASRNAQQTLLSSRVSLVTAQRDRIVASYEVLHAIGRLSAETLGLKVARYDSTQHFDQVKGRLFGTDAH